MSGHYREQCKHGRVVRQCRCPYPLVPTTVACPPTCEQDPPQEEKEGETQ